MEIQGKVIAPSNASSTDGNLYTPLMGKLNDFVVSHLQGKYATQMYRGNLFYGSTTNAGVAVPADNATAQVFGLWNPAGSGKICVPVHFRAGIVTLGTRVVSAFHLNFLPNAGSAIGAAGAPITAFTDTTPKTCLKGGAGSPVTRFTLAATTIAMSDFFFLGLQHDLATGGSPPPFVVDFDGTIGIGPNNAAFIGSSDAATGSTYGMTIVWMEIPI